MSAVMKDEVLDNVVAFETETVSASRPMRAPDHSFHERMATAVRIHDTLVGYSLADARSIMNMVMEHKGKGGL